MRNKPRVVQRPSGAQSNTVPKLSDSEGPRTSLVVSKALTGSKPIRKESPRILWCHPDSESALRHLILIDGLLNPAHQNPNHQAMGAKIPQSRQYHCHQSKQHLCDSATPQKARLIRLNLPRPLPKPRTRLSSGMAPWSASQQHSFASLEGSHDLHGASRNTAVD
jgi:hypothetical protein